MILAAGFGTRLLPYSKILPKPLFPLLNQPLLLLTIGRLQKAGFDHIIVNCHYLKEQIMEALNGISGVVIQEEETVLGTGGGLRMALPLMRDEPLLVTNGDIYHCINYQELYHSHRPEQEAVTMALHHYPRFNAVTVQEGRVRGFHQENATDPLAFTGLHVLNPEILTAMESGTQCSIIDRYQELLAEEGAPIRAQRVDGCYWTDMGTVKDYLALHGELLKGEIPLWDEFSSPAPKRFLLGDVGRESSSPQLYDWACIGDNVQTGKGVQLKRCVVWDGTRLKDGGYHADSLLVPQLHD